jgi:Zn-dependent peptidase ImmA (M78 family)
MEKMLDLAYKENILVEKFDFAPPLRGIYMCQPDSRPIIGLDVKLNSVVEERSIMAEELGHHFTSVGYCVNRQFYNYSTRLHISKIEYKALRWAANYLISDDDLLDAFKDGIDGISSLAEYFMVVPEIVRLRVKLFEKPVY